MKEYYKIITGRKEFVQEQINDLWEDGWRPYGNLTFNPNNGIFMYIQSMVKKEYIAEVNKFSFASIPSPDGWATESSKKIMENENAQ